jgi:DUF2924 family protein
MSVDATQQQSSDPRIAKPALQAEITRLDTLRLDNLRSAWQAEFLKEPPSGLTPDLLLRTLAWRIQEKAFGGHDRATLKFLDACARGNGADSIFRRLKSGAVLVREYQGARHTVTIAQNGYVWQEKIYSSLSIIARAITGTHWNGPRFFGLRQDPEKEKQSGGAT